MPLRSYDPSIARWTTQDPVIHYNYSPYSAFDNNPVYYSDPSGADGENPYGYYDNYGDPYQGWALDGEPQTASQRIFGSHRPGTNGYFAHAFGESYIYAGAEIAGIKVTPAIAAFADANPDRVSIVNPRNSVYAEDLCDDCSKCPESCGGNSYNEDLDNIIIELTQEGNSAGLDILDQAKWVGKTSNGRLRIYDKIKWPKGNQHTTNINFFKKAGHVGLIVSVTTDAVILANDPSYKSEFKKNTGLSILGLVHPTYGSALLIHSLGSSVSNYIIEHPETKNFARRLLNDFDRWIYELENQ